MPIDQLQFTNPQAYSGGADFTPLSKLYDVYKASQQRAMEEAALARLGPDMAQNTQALIASGVPGLATQGINLQQAAINRQREDAQHAIVNARMAEAQKLAQGRFGIEQSAERRVQEEYKKKLADEADAARLMSGFTGTTPKGTAPAPFPAPLPGAAPQAVPPQAVAAGGDGDGGGESGGGPAETGLPAWVNPVTAKIATNLVSGQPAAAAGVARDQIAELYRNPITRPLAVAFLQKQLTPDEWSYHFDNESGRVIATSKTDPSRTRDVTPGAVAGQAPASKQEREVSNYYKAGLAQGLTEEQARAFALNKGKQPSEDRTATQIKETEKADDSVFAAQAALTQIDKAQASSEKAFQGIGASQLGAVMSNLPSWVPGQQAGVATRVLENQQLRAALGQLQDAFGRNPSNREDQIMIKLQGAVNEPIEVRRQILQDAKEILQERLAKNQRKSELMHSGEYFRKGSAGVPTDATPAPKPSPSADLEAAKWARANPNDPRAQAIIQHLKSKQSGL
jgi:hypothetical protein